MPLSLRIDPWNPDYESAVQFDDERADDADVDPFVESELWDQPVLPQTAARPGSIAFVDGVQRIETRVIGDDAGKLVFGAFTSIGVGAAFVRERSATLDTGMPDRVLALTDGASYDPVEVPCGNISLQYRIESTGASGVDAVHEALMNARRAAETALGQRLLAEGHPLVIVDGRLNLQPTRRSMTVGLIKTIHKTYLSGQQLALLGKLPPHARTPLFRIGRDRPVYSWYLRLALPRAIDHPWAGIVRVETLDSIGLERAAALADTTAEHLPAFASDSAWDPRAPQNLYPIGALEQRLRHLLGDREWIRRHIEAHFHRTGAAA